MQGLLLRKGHVPRFWDGRCRQPTRVPLFSEKDRCAESGHRARRVSCKPHRNSSPQRVVCGRRRRAGWRGERVCAEQAVRAAGRRGVDFQPTILSKFQPVVSTATTSSTSTPSQPALSAAPSGSPEARSMAAAVPASCSVSTPTPCAPRCVASACRFAAGEPPEVGGDARSGAALVRYSC